MNTKRGTRGMGRVYQRGGVWWISYYYGGAKRRETSKSANRADAVRLLKDRIAAITAGTYAPRADKVTLKELRDLVAANYALNTRRSGERVTRAFVHLAGYFGETARAVTITSDRLTAYAAERQHEAKPATIRYELACLRRGFNLAKKAGRLNIVPNFPSIAVHNARQGFVSREQREEILARLPEDVRPLVEFLALTGWRKGEALKLEWRNVNLSAKIIVLDRTKSGEPRLLPYGRSEKLSAIIAEQQKRADATKAVGRITPYVFTRDNGQPIRSIHGAWKRATRGAGLPGRLLHDLRRSFARDMSNAGVPQAVVMKLAGWETDSVFRRYRIVSEQDLGDALEKGHNSGTVEGMQQQVAAVGGSQVVDLVVPEKGLEPLLPFGNGILSPARLPFRHSGSNGEVVYQMRYALPHASGVVGHPR